MASELHSDHNAPYGLTIHNIAQIQCKSKTRQLVHTDDDDMWPFSMHDISLNLGDLLPPLALTPPLIPR